MSDDVAPRSVSADALRMLKYEIEREVALGLSCDHEVLWSSVDWVLMDFDEDKAALNWHGERLLLAAIAEHARQQATWPVTTDCTPPPDRNPMSVPGAMRCSGANAR